MFLLLFSFQSHLAQERFLTVRSKDTVNGKPQYTTSLGVNMKLNGFLDVFGGLQDSETFNVGNIDVFKDDDEPSLSFDLYQTQIKWQTNYTTRSGQELLSVVEGDFWGGNGRFRLRKAYVESSHWQIGQNWNAFGDEFLWPNIMEWEGPPSGVWIRTPHIKYFNTLKDIRWEYEISIEAPINDYNSFPDIELLLREVNQLTPDLVLAFKRKMEWGHLRLSSILRSIRYEYDEKKDNFYGYGLSFSGIHVHNRNNFQFQFVGGKGITAYMTTLGGNGYDGYPTNQNKLDATPSIGGWTSYEYFLNDKLHTNLVFGYTHFTMDDGERFFIYDDPDSDIDGITISGDYAQNHYYGIFNLMYDLFEQRMTIGLELDYGVKKIVYDGSLNDNTINERASRDAMRISFGFMFYF